MSLFTKNTAEAREDRLDLFREEVESIFSRLQEEGVGTLPIPYLVDFCRRELKWSDHLTMTIIQDLVKNGELKAYQMPVVELIDKKAEKKPVNKTLTSDQHAVLRTVKYWSLDEFDPLTAKQVGIENGVSEKNAAAWARPKLKRLMELNMIGQYTNDVRVTGAKIGTYYWRSLHGPFEI